MDEKKLMQKLHNIENTVQKYYEKDRLWLEKIKEAFSLIKNQYTSQQDEPMILHAVSVAELLAKWRMDYSIIIEGLLHDLFKNSSFERKTIFNNFSSRIVNELEQYLDLSARLEQSESNLDLASQSVLSPYYILAAEYLDNLWSGLDNPSEQDRLRAEQTRNFLIPKLQKYHAFKIINELEEACFKILNKETYKEMNQIVDSFYAQSQTYTKGFFQSLNRLFKSDYGAENSRLSRYRPHISKLYRGKRSYISLYRFITRFAETKSEKLSLLKNTYVTAFWDITLVVDDKLDIHNSLNKEELFFTYYQEILRKKGIHFLGYHTTSYGDSTYFLISDEIKNIYRFFIKTESEHLRYLCGDIIDYCDFITDTPNTRVLQKICVFCPDGRPLYFNPGSTVLDFAFSIHKNIGFQFDYAIINEDYTKRYGCHYLLNDGDKIQVVSAEEPKAKLSWFRHVNTDTAKDALIQYFNSKIYQNTSDQ